MKIPKMYPPGATRVRGKDVPLDLVVKLKGLELIRTKRTPRTLNMMAILGKLECRQGEFKERAPGKGRKGGRFGRAGPSYASLQSVREGIAEFLIGRHKVTPFLPIARGPHGMRITTAKRCDGFLQRWVSVSDSDENDVEGWLQVRFWDHGDFYTQVEARDLYRHSRNRASLIRVWLPALGLLVQFTPTGSSPVKAVPSPKRRGYLIFPFKTLWTALKVA